MINTKVSKITELLVLAQHNQFIDGFEVHENDLWIRVGSVKHTVRHDKVWMFMVGLLRETSLQQRGWSGNAAA